MCLILFTIILTTLYSYSTIYFILFYSIYTLYSYSTIYFILFYFIQSVLYIYISTIYFILFYFILFHIQLKL